MSGVLARAPGGNDITASTKTVKKRSTTRFEIITCKSALPEILNYRMKEYSSTLMLNFVMTSQRSNEKFLIVKSLSITCEKACDRVTSNGFEVLRLSLYSSSGFELPRISVKLYILLVFVV
jgi:hypothetical protein